MTTRLMFRTLQYSCVRRTPPASSVRAPWAAGPPTAGTRGALDSQQPNQGPPRWRKMVENGSASRPPATATTTATGTPGLVLDASCQHTRPVATTRRMAACSYSIAESTGICSRNQLHALAPLTHCAPAAAARAWSGSSRLPRSSARRSSRRWLRARRSPAAAPSAKSCASR